MVGLRNTDKQNQPAPWAQAVTGLLVWFADCQNGKPLSLLDSVLIGLPPDLKQSEERQRVGRKLANRENNRFRYRLHRLRFSIGCHWRKNFLAKKWVLIQAHPGPRR